MLFVFLCSGARIVQISFLKCYHRPVSSCFLILPLFPNVFFQPPAYIKTKEHQSKIQFIRSTFSLSNYKTPHFICPNIFFEFIGFDKNHPKSYISILHAAITFGIPTF